MSTTPPRCRGQLANRLTRVKPEGSMPMSGSASEIRAFRQARRREKLGTLLVAESIVFELERFLEPYGNGGSARRLLDLGAGSRPYASLYEERFAECLSTDVETSPHDIGGLDMLAPAEHLPFADASFDVVLCTEVLEHCSDPSAAMGEIALVLKLGGSAFITTPFMVQLHEMPRDYHRFTPTALEKLVTDAGLSLESLRPRGDYLALALLIALFPVSKLLEKASSMSGVPLNDARNPLAWAVIALPQRIYFELWRLARLGRAPALAMIHHRLSRFALGFTTVARRPEVGPHSGSVTDSNGTTR